MPDVYVYIIDLPSGINEMVLPCADGSYTIYLSSSLSYKGKVEAYLHAIRHIENGDCEKEEDINKIEYEAHHEDHKNSIGKLSDGPMCRQR